MGSQTVKPAEAGFGSYWVLCQTCLVVAPGTYILYFLWVWEKHEPMLNTMLARHCMDLGLMPA